MRLCQEMSLLLYHSSLGINTACVFEACPRYGTRFVFRRMHYRAPHFCYPPFFEKLLVIAI
jgi:hypothetical protein